MIKNSNTIPPVVASYMDKYGCNNAEYIATSKDGEVYSLSLLDEDGNIQPIGLPILVIVTGNDAIVLTGMQALKYQGLLSLDD